PGPSRRREERLVNAVLESTRPTPARGSLFQRILVGIDRSPESIEAARQGARLLDRGGTLTLLAIQSLAPPVGGLDGALAPAYVDADAEWLFVRETLAEARAALEPSIEPVAKIARGSAGNELLAEASDGGHTLLAVGTHGMGRLRGI